MKASEISKIVIETKGIAIGIVIKDEELSRVRVGESGTYRKAKDGQTLDTVLDWLKANDFQFSNRVVSGKMGTVTIKTFYTRGIN